MRASAMSISLTEALKRFVKERTKAGNFSNPSDYVCSLIREDQRRLAAEKVLAEMVAKHVAANPSVSPENLDKLRAEFWLRWIELKGEIDKGLASIEANRDAMAFGRIVEDLKRQ